MSSTTTGDEILAAVKAFHVAQSRMDRAYKRLINRPDDVALTSARREISRFHNARCRLHELCERMKEANGED